MTALLALVALIATPQHAFAQTTPERDGFTFLVDAGFGLQHDRYYSDTSIGIGGVNVGVGTFIQPDLAVLVRYVGTTVHYDALIDGYRQFSGTVGASLQRWVSDRLNVEAGIGIGFWWDRVNFSSPALGASVGVGYTVLKRGRHNVQVGVQDAPAFTQPGAIHNVSVTLGYQRF